MAAVTVRYWAGAARAAGTDSEVLEAGTVAELRTLLSDRPALTAVSRIASFLVDGAQAGDAAPLPPGAVVDVLPPFAGG
jgi:molybdopterin synthase sulfur carrier subunit